MGRWHNYNTFDGIKRHIDIRMLAKMQAIDKENREVRLKKARGKKKRVIKGTKKVKPYDWSWLDKKVKLSVGEIFELAMKESGITYIAITQSRAKDVYFITVGGGGPGRPGDTVEHAAKYFYLDIVQRKMTR